MTAQVLAAELSALAQESKKKNADIRNVSVARTNSGQNLISYKGGR